MNKRLLKGWQKSRLGNICNLEYGFTDTAKNNGDTRFIRITDINQHGKILEKDRKFINISLQSKKYLLKKNDILITRTGATFGKTAIFNKKYSAVFASYLIRLKFLESSKFLPKYYYYFSQSKKYWDQALILVKGGAQPQFNANVIRQIRISYPPLQEQKRIVEVLSTWDQAIEKLEQLISAKQKQFQWLLHKLIYSQKNNPHWKQLSLEKLLHYEQPTNYIVNSTKYNSQYNTPVLTAGKTFILGYTNEKKDVFPMNKLPVIIFDDFTTATQFVDFQFKVKSSAMKILLPKTKRVNIKFIFYSMKNIDFQIKSHRRYWIAQYSKIIIPLPSFFEQEKIIQTLSNYEKEIEILKKLSEKYQKQKKGLIQKLLTGQWRTKL